MPSDNGKIENMVREGQRLLGLERKIKQEKVAADKYKSQQKWRILYGSAKRALPVEIAQYLAQPNEIEYGNNWAPATYSNYYNWQIKITSIVPIEVRFGDTGMPCLYSVPLTDPFFEGSIKVTKRDFSGEKSLEMALAFALEQTNLMRKKEAERLRMEKEYEERERQEIGRASCRERV